jgi:DNA topoisomerase-3
MHIIALRRKWSSESKYEHALCTGLLNLNSINTSDVMAGARMQGMTHAPPKLSERDLISAMERHGIGTDATVADHIQKQLDRGYAVKDAAQLFAPTPLGEALVASYHKMGLSNLWQPTLRCATSICLQSTSQYEGFAVHI